MNNRDVDIEMALIHIEDYIKSVVHQFEDGLWNSVEKMQQENTIITYRKMKRIKKHILFKMLKLGNKK